MTEVDDVERASRKLVSVNAGLLLLVVYLLSEGLDVIDLFLVIVDPKSVARFACSIRPLALVPVPSISGLSPQSISDPCLGEVREPAISLIFLSTKLTMACLVFVMLWGFVYCRPDGFRALKDIYWRRFKAPGGYQKELQSFTKSYFGVIIFLSCCLFLASIDAAEPKLSFILGLKFIFEDGLAVAIPAVALDVTAKAFLFISFAWAHRDSAPGHDG